ncbi:MAG: hypothetical protein QN121_04480 [Armatimonadota bacterium]|nr:hypothetical protein [Armatimonadota bacterium]
MGERGDRARATPTQMKPVQCPTHRLRADPKGKFLSSPSGLALGSEVYFQAQPGPSQV